MAGARWKLRIAAAVSPAASYALKSELLDGPRLGDAVGWAEERPDIKISNSRERTSEHVPLSILQRFVNPS
jgi:hypothetical protein